jgi:tryptophan synthase alpha chain
MPTKTPANTANGNRLAERLQAAKAAGRKSVLPYLTAGFPDLDATVALLERCDAAGCAAVEIGFPFSDSIADGPVIQESFYRALDGGICVADIFSAIRKVRGRLRCGLLAMVSMSLVRRRGLEEFLNAAKEAGFDGVIVPDVPLEECAALARATQARGLCNVLMAAPTTDPGRRQKIAEQAAGFVYIISTKGITGERTTLSADLAGNIAALRSATGVPLVVGFGISTPAHVREVCAAADGVIVGSAIVRRIAACIEKKSSRNDLVASLGEYVDELVAAAGGPIP